MEIAKDSLPQLRLLRRLSNEHKEASQSRAAAVDALASFLPAVSIQAGADVSHDRESNQHSRGRFGPDYRHEQNKQQYREFWEHDL